MQLQISVFKKKEMVEAEGKFSNARPLEERITFGAELAEGEGSARRLFGRTLSALARNIALNMNGASDFKLVKGAGDGRITHPMEDSEVVELDHSITHHLKLRAKSAAK